MDCKVLQNTQNIRNTKAHVCKWQTEDLQKYYDKQKERKKYNKIYVEIMKWFDDLSNLFTICVS